MNLSRPRAILYLRLSDAKEASTSLVRQEADLRALADREGWEVLEPLLVDNDMSGGYERDNAKAALEAIRTGTADVLAVWKLDRFGRRGVRDVGDIAVALEDRPERFGPGLFVALMDSLRSDGPLWETFAALLAGQAKQERLNTMARVKNSRAHLAKVGRFPGGVVPFGYETAPHPDGAGRILVPNLEETLIAREVGESLASDGSLYSAARMLNARGIPATRSAARRARLMGRDWADLDRGRWMPTATRNLFTGNTLLGYFVRDGRLVTGDDGLPVQLWEPILDAETVERIRRRFPREGVTERRVRASRLLSGLLYCESCGSVTHTSTNRGKPIYQCAGRGTLGLECRNPKMYIHRVDPYVSEQYLAIAGDWPEVREVEQIGNPTARADLARIEQALREASADIVQPGADRLAIVQRIDDLEARAATLRSLPTEVTTIVEPTGRTLREAWDAAEDVGIRRRMLSRAIDHVTLASLPEGLPRKGNHAAVRLRIHWAQPDGELGYFDAA